MEETIQAIASNGVQPTVVPNAEGQSQVAATGVENQYSAEIADLQAKEAELDKYLSSKGGEDKARSFISDVEERRKRFEEKQALVEAHKAATKENSQYVWAERGEELIQTVQSQPQLQQQVAPQPPVESEQTRMMKNEINRGVLRDFSTEFADIQSSIQDGSLLKEAASQGFTVVRDGLIDRDQFRKYAEYAANRYKYENMSMPQSDSTPVVEMPDYERIPEGQMTKEVSIQIMKESIANVRAGKAPHPDYERAVKVQQTGQTL